MIAGDDGWDEPVPLPEEEETVAAAPPSAPAPLAPTPAPGPPPPTPSGTGPGPRRNVLLAVGAVVVVAIVAVVVVVAGGSSSKHKPHSTGLTHAQLVTAADKICAQVIQQQATDVRNGDLAAAANVTQAGAERLRQLKPPAADKAALDQYISAVENAVNALRAGDTAGYVREAAASTTLATQLGLQECATGQAQTG